MLIPSIDLMGGKIVQLIQGKKKALEFDNFEEWIVRFLKYPLVQLIDLDAAMGRGNNFALVREIAKRLPCQMGGGIRSLDAAKAARESGARHGGRRSGRHGDLSRPDSCVALLLPDPDAGLILESTQENLTMNVLVLNAGSSILKFQIIETDLEQIKDEKDDRICRGEIESIGGEAILRIRYRAEPVRLRERDARCRPQAGAR